jgi:hypothetical protein
MRATRSVVRRDVRTFDVEAIDGGAFAQRFLGAFEVAQCAHHAVRRSGDHRGIEARDACGEEAADGVRDLFRSALGIVEIHTQKAVHLQIDEPGAEIKFGGVAHGRDGGNVAVEGHLNRSPAGSFNSNTIHGSSALYTG